MRMLLLIPAAATSYASLHDVSASVRGLFPNSKAERLDPFFSFLQPFP